MTNNTTSNMDMTVTISAPGSSTPQIQHRKQSLIVHLEADCEVLAVTAEGTPTKAILTLKSLKAAQDGTAATGLPSAGSKIVAESTGKHAKTFTMEGKTLGPAATQFLHDCAPIGLEGVNDQIMFGPKEPVAVGATWPAGPAMLTNLQESFPTATSLQGRVKLDSVEGSGDHQVAKVSGDLALLGVTEAPLPPPQARFPSQLTTQLSVTVPVASKGAFVESLKMGEKFSGEADQNGAHLKFDATANGSFDQTITVP